jgi:ATP-dependent DNA helicase RecQ
MAPTPSGGVTLPSKSDNLLAALRQLTGNADAQFHSGQREAIESLVVRRERLVLVQRTGWGKSAVYFVATRLLRDERLGATLLISPLLALMRNQIDAAERLGLRTYTINSSSENTIVELVSLLEADSVDLVVISPERLANPDFADQVMPLIGRRPGLTVVDEVHCISDWGHDFRPDYRRIGKMLSAFPEGIPILGCTATANNRVMEDAREQLGHNAVVQRGPLSREGLTLGVLDLPEPARRLAWLSTYVAGLPGSGIVYCLTVRDVDLVAMWLRKSGINARPYYGGLELDDKEASERMLLEGSLKVLVATTALGMGYDNPRVGFVVHYQTPGSVVHYYQQVGRAGRALEASVGVLLQGGEDEKINEWFIDTAFPSEEQVAQVLGVFDHGEGYLTILQISEEVNLKYGQIESVLKQLDVAGAVRRVGWQNYERTLSPWTYPRERVAALATIRKAELVEMKGYAEDTGCRMAFLTRALDDNTMMACGMCDNCTGVGVRSEVEPDAVQRAQMYLDGQFGVVETRKQDGKRRSIPPTEQTETGRYLCHFGDFGFGESVKSGKEARGVFDESLVDALVDMVTLWSPTPTPTSLTFVPSSNHPLLVPDLAKRVATKLGLPLLDLLERVRPGRPQKTMQNSAHQATNVEGAFAIREGIVLPVELGPVLLLDDIVDSRWTMTEIGRILRRAGFAAVYPVALASSTK